MIALLSSCAIHDKFPFICFRKECIIAEFSGVRKEAGGKRSIKQRTNMMVTKVKRKIKKARGGPNTRLTKLDYEVAETILTDTAKVKELIKMVFLHKNQDTLESIIFRDSINIKSSLFSLSKNDRILIKYCLNEYVIKNIVRIYLFPVVTSPEDSVKINAAAIRKMNNIEHYLIKTGVKRSKIEIRKN